MQPAFFHFFRIHPHLTFIPDNLSHYLFATSLFQIPHLPSTHTDFLISDHLIRRWKLFKAHLWILYLVDKYLNLCLLVLFFYLPELEALKRNPGRLLLVVWLCSCRLQHGFYVVRACRCSSSSLPILDSVWANSATVVRNSMFSNARNTVIHGGTFTTQDDFQLQCRKNPN